MFARMTTWRVGAERRPELERLADELSAWLATMAGFRTATYLADDASGRYSSLTVWDTEEVAEAAAQASAGRLRHAVAALGHEPEIQAFEIYEPPRRQRWGAV